MRKLSSVFIFFGTIISVLSLVFLVTIYYPVITLELNYWLNGPGKESVSTVKSKNVLVPRDTEFGIVIPKIRANAKVIPNVNPYNPKDYQFALTKGVAHAKGTGLPGQGKNIFLFSHSSVNFLEAVKYNSIFYLLDKLEKNDEIYVFYKKAKFKYKVVEKKLVDPKEISYLSLNSKTEELTLMTCWPPGTTLKRLLVIAILTK